jgi:hypothetical protein
MKIKGFWFVIIFMIVFHFMSCTNSTPSKFIPDNPFYVSITLQHTSSTIAKIYILLFFRDTSSIINISNATTVTCNGITIPHDSYGNYIKDPFLGLSTGDTVNFVIDCFAGNINVTGTIPAFISTNVTSISGASPDSQLWIIKN